VNVFIASTNLTNKVEVGNSFNALLNDDQSLNVLVNAAATLGPKETLEDVDGSAFLEGIQRNLEAALYTAQAFLRHTADNTVVVDVNSSASHINFSPLFPSYSVTKLAVFRIWDIVAFTHPNIFIFHIQPGVVDTDINRQVGGVKATGVEDRGAFKLATSFPGCDSGKAERSSLPPC
jgi:NAD(P)-dependent dehydrogenase (short-subunit alcohol dehydrogenase family)